MSTKNGSGQTGDNAGSHQDRLTRVFMAGTAVIEIARNSQRARIARRGAKLVGLQGADGSERMWQGDLETFVYTSPLFFPVVDCLSAGSALVEGARAPMRLHGVAKDAIFDIVAHDTESCLLQWVPGPGELPCYPCEFGLGVGFAFDGCGLTQTVTVTNREPDRPLPFNIAFHPAFVARWDSGGSCQVHFPDDDTLTLNHGRGEFRSDESGLVDLNNRRLDITAQDLISGALMFGGLRSDNVSATLPGWGAALGLSFQSMGCLAFWRHPKVHSCASSHGYTCQDRRANW